MFRLLVISLSFLCSTAYAADNITAIFADSQFTASPYGVALARECMNPTSIRDARQVQIFANPAGHTDHLLHDISLPVLGSGQAFVHRIVANRDGDSVDINGPGRTENTHPRRYFQRALELEDVNRVMIFLGINEINNRNENWTRVAQEIREAGKQCVVSLPTLTSNTAMNQRVLAYNRYVSHQLENSNCRIVDTSNSLEENTEQHILFQTDSNGIHFVSSSAGSAARATCRAFAETFSGPENLDPQDEPEMEDAPRQENPAPAPGVNFENIDTDDLPFLAPSEM